MESGQIQSKKKNVDQEWHSDKTNPLQYSCLGILKDRGAWQTTVHGVKKESDTIEGLNSNET